MEFKVKDKVKVINPGKRYARYKSFIEKYAPDLLRMWAEDEGLLSETTIYEIKTLGKHTNYSVEIAIIGYGDKVWLVETTGLEKIEEEEIKRSICKLTSLNLANNYSKKNMQYESQRLINKINEIVDFIGEGGSYE